MRKDEMTAAPEYPADPGQSRSAGIVTRPNLEPIAIVGMGCRLPGGAADPTAFWELLSNGVDAIEEVPESRWSLGEWYDAEPQAGKTYARWGGFIDDVDRFDAAFFGVSPREAAAIDPQQRLLLQTAYEALEDAGQTPAQMRSRRTGVYVGMWGSDYEDFLFSDPAHIDFYRTQGTGRYTAAGRLSFLLGLEGPSLALDTACSSSLVTVHLACQAIRNGDCELALAGGVNLLLQPQITIAYSQSRMMATDGRCRFGDATGSGYVRSEGVGLIVLKTLSAAMADGDPIYAVIRGSAVNNDGQSSGSFGTPGVRGQEAMLRHAYKTAGVDPREVRFIEAHGTGTKRGDPVEVRALANVLCEKRRPEQPLLIGSVKTNIGHMEAAAGIGGLLKATLALHKRKVPASLHFNEPNPNIPFALLPLEIPTELTPLPEDGQVHYAGVNSFGISGTNAHVVLAEAPVLPERQFPGGANESGAGLLLNLSAKSPAALRVMAERYRDFIQSDAPGAQSLTDLCYTLSCRRTGHEHRLSLGGRTREEFVDGLDAFLNEQEAPGVATAESRGSYQAPPVRDLAFVYSGQGSHWTGMGRDLLAREEVFRVMFEEVDRAIAAHTQWSVLAEIESGARLDDIDVMWPAIFAVQVALTEYLKSMGLRPAAVVGHSIGEAAAAWASGALSLEDAAKVIVVQGRCVQRVAGQGAMALVGVNFEELQEAIDEASPGDEVVAAIQSSPESAVMSGSEAAIAQMLARFEERGVFARRVNTSAAVHSPQMDALREDLLQELAGLKGERGTIPFYSATLGTAYDSANLDARYFYENLRQPVRFASAVEAIFFDGPAVFLELSPHPIVKPSVEETLRGHQSPGFAFASLSRPPEDVDAAGGDFGLNAIGRALSGIASVGVPLDLARVRRESQISALRLHTGRPRLAFICSGQGPQWWAMGRELYEREPLFRAKFHEIDGLLSAIADWSLLDELIRADEDQSRLSETRFAQPAIFALQVGLATLWRAWGVEPEAIAGHSVGEVAAAHISGKLSLEDAVYVIYHRGRLMQEATGLGKMAAIEAPLDTAREFIVGYEARVAIGAANSPGSTVLSGETAALEEVLAKVEAAGIYQKMLPVNYAFHSPQMEPFKQQMTAAMNEYGLSVSVPEIPIVSTVTGELADDAAYGAEYWGDNIREGVMFATAVDTLIANGFEYFVEIGPHPVLSAYMLQCLEQADRPGHAIPSLRRNQPEHLTLLGNYGALYCAGYPVDWTRRFGADAAAIAAGTAPRCVRLPAYPWQTERHWIDAPKQQSRRSASSGDAAHPLLGGRLDTAAAIYEAVPEIADLPVAGPLGQPDLLHPLALLESAALAAQHNAQQKPAKRGHARPENRMVAALSDANWFAFTGLEQEGEVGELEFQHICQAAPAPPGGTRAKGSEPVQIAVYDRSEGYGEWTAAFTAAAGEDASAAHALEPLDLAATQARIPTGVDLEDLVARLPAFFSERGVAELPAGAVEIRRSGSEALVAFDWSSGDAEAATAGDFRGLRLPAAVLDALNALVCDFAREALHENTEALQHTVYLPESCANFALATDETRSPHWLHVKIEETRGAASKGDSSQGTGALIVSGGVYGDQGVALARFAGLQFCACNRSDLLNATRRGLRGWIYEHGWEGVPLPAGAPLSGLHIVIADGPGAEVAARLVAAGQQVLLAEPGAAYSYTGDRATVPLADPTAFERLLEDAARNNDAQIAALYYAPALSVALTGAEHRLREPGPEWSAELEALSGGLLYLSQALLRAELPQLPPLLVLTAGAQAVRAQAGHPDPHQATLWGLGTAIENEHPELDCRRIDLDPRASLGEQIGLVLLEAAASAGTPGESNESRVAYRRGKRYVERLSAVNTAAGADVESLAGGSADRADLQPVALDSSDRSTFENLLLRPMDRRVPRPDEVEVRVRATGLNFRDVLGALGEYPGGPEPFGIECAGTIAAVGENVTDLSVGDDVIGLATEAAFASYTTMAADLVIRKPDHISFREGATIPVVFLTAFYGLHRFGRIAPGDRVLIHSAAGGVGLAAIQLAKLMGAEVYATVSTDEKRAMLSAMGVKYIYNSRSLDFADGVLTDTNGEGVDIVLNSLAGEYIAKGIGLLRKHGRFIEIGKKGLLTAKEVAQIKKGVSYFVIDLMDVAHNQPDLIQSMLLHLAEEFGGGDLQPLPCTAYDLSAVQTAFMDMARGRHIGKLVVEQDANVTALNAGVSGTGPATFAGVRPNVSYLITGGLGGLGLLFARSLAEAGATHIVLSGRSAPKDAALASIAEIEALEHVEVVSVVQGDVAREADVIAMLETIDSSGVPLAGVLHTAGIVRDGLFLNMKWSQFEAVAEAKILGAFNLHKHTCNRQLDLFVLFSSIVATIGSRAQANYATANAYMDALAHYRRSLGLAGLSVNWGPWAGAGMAQGLAERGAANWNDRGISFLPAEIGVDAMMELLERGSAQAGVYRIQWARFAEQFAGGKRAPGLYANLLANRESGSAAVSTTSGVGVLRELLEAPAPARPRMIFEHVREQIAKILGLPSAQAVDVTKGFKEMGLDSLMTVELRNRLQKNLQCSLPATLAFDYPNVEMLSGFLHDQALDFSDASGDAPTKEEPGAKSVPAEETSTPASAASTQQPAAAKLQNTPTSPATDAGARSADVAGLVDSLESTSEDDALAELLGL